MSSHSWLGGVTALLVAAERPDLARALVVAEASPSQGTERELADVRDALARWPVPFASREAAVAYFGGAEVWADGLERREDGLWPRFDVDVMARTLRGANRRSYWQEWDRIRCPVLVVRGANGTIPSADAQAMIARLPQARHVELAGASHDLHLDRPAAWREAVSRFLEQT